MGVDVCLVELKTPENIGFIARIMKNFGFENLYLLNCNVNEMSYITASHGSDILRNAKVVSSLDEVLLDKNLVIATTGIPGVKEERYLRRPIFYPDELRNFLKGKSVSAVILFGREDYGLLNEEIELSDIVVTIPTNPEYPVLNVSHAVAIILYELKKSAYEVEEKCYADTEDINVLVSYYEGLLRKCRYPPHRIPRTLLMLKRVHKRALMTKKEYSTYLGVIRKIKIYIDGLYSKGRRDGDE